MEVRIGSEDANASLNEYRFRLSPSNPGEVKANKEYHKKHRKTLSTQQEVALNQALTTRYQMLIDALYYQSILQSLNSQKEGIARLSQAALVNIQNLDIGDIIDIQSDETKLLGQIEDYQYKLNQTEYLMALDLPEVVGLDLTQLNWKSPSQINDYIKNHESLKLKNNLYLLQAEENLDLKKQLLKIEKAEARSNIGYIQANLDTERGNELNEHVGFQIGVRIPIVNPDKPDLNRERVELIEREKELSETKSMMSQKKDLLILELDFLNSRRKMIQERIDMVNRVKIHGGNVSISELSKLATYEYQLALEQMTVEKEIRKIFIQYLNMQGLLVQRPLINHLSLEMKSFELE